MNEFTVSLDTPWFPHHLPLFMLASDDYDQQNDISYTLQQPEDWSFDFERLNESVDLTITRPLQLVNEYLQTKSLTAVARVFHSKTGVIYRQDVADHPGDLTGDSTVGFVGIDEHVAEAIVASMSFNSSVGLEPVHGQPIESFKNNDIDALLPASMIPDGMVLQLSGENVDMWHFNDFSIPENGDLVLVGSSELIESNPNSVQSVVHDLHKAVTDIQNSSDPIENLYSKYVPGWDNSPLNKSLVQSTIPQFTEIFSQDFETYRSWSEFLSDEAGMEGYFDIDQLMDERFLPIDAMSF